MRTFLKIIAGIVILGVIIYGVLMIVTSGSREVAREFILKLSSGDYAAAQEYLHPRLRQKFPAPAMAEAFADVAPYVEVSFGSLEAGSGGLTKLEGTAKTASGCSSHVRFELVDAQITFFEIKPFCPKE